MVNKEMYIERIMASSKKLFLDKGYKNASLVEVADKTKIGRRTIYRYFENKELLLIKVVTECFEDFNNYLENIDYEAGISAYGKLEFLFDSYLTYFLSNPEMLKLMSMVEVNVSVTSKETDIYKKFVVDSAFPDKILMDLLLESRTEGSIFFEVDIEILTLTINNSLLSLASRVFNHKSQLDKEQGIESTLMLVTLRDLILKSISVR